MVVLFHLMHASLLAFTAAQQNDIDLEYAKNGNVQSMFLISLNMYIDLYNTDHSTVIGVVVMG